MSVLQKYLSEEQLRETDRVKTAEEVSKTCYDLTACISFPDSIIVDIFKSMIRWSLIHVIKWVSLKTWITTVLESLR